MTQVNGTSARVPPKPRYDEENTGQIPTETSPGPVQTIGVTKNKESPRKDHRLEEAGETGAVNDILDWILEQKRNISGKSGEMWAV